MYNFRFNHDQGEGDTFVTLLNLDTTQVDSIIQTGEHPPVVAYMDKEVVANDEYCWEYLE